MTKHTPGPWLQSIDNGRVIQAGRTKIAVASPTTPPPTAWANAKLIAAAPEMLDFARAVVRYAGNSGDDYLADKAREVIAKATGE
jgi:hypothetical protein